MLSASSGSPREAEITKCTWSVVTCGWFALRLRIVVSMRVAASKSWPLVDPRETRVVRDTNTVYSVRDTMRHRETRRDAERHRETQTAGYAWLRNVEKSPLDNHNLILIAEECQWLGSA